MKRYVVEVVGRVGVLVENDAIIDEPSVLLAADVAMRNHQAKADNISARRLTVKRMITQRG